MEKRFFKKVGNWLFIIAVLKVEVNSALKGNFEGFIWPLVALGFYYALCMADYMNDDLIAIIEGMIETLNDLERQLKVNKKSEGNETRVKATGIVLGVYPSHIIRDNVKETIWYKTPQGACFTKDELEFIDTENNFDYWTRLEHQYAGMAMQGLMSYVEQITPKEGRSFCDEIVDISIKVAHALVEKLKKESK